RPRGSATGDVAAAHGRRAPQAQEDLRRPHARPAAAGALRALGEAARQAGPPAPPRRRRAGGRDVRGAPRAEAIVGGPRAEAIGRREARPEANGATGTGTRDPEIRPDTIPEAPRAPFRSRRLGGRQANRRRPAPRRAKGASQG